MVDYINEMVLIIHKVSNKYEKFMDKTSFQYAYNGTKQLIEQHGNNLTCDELPRFERYCNNIYLEYFIK